jgi:hypothetical protein
MERGHKIPSVTQINPVYAPLHTHTLKILLQKP